MKILYHHRIRSKDGQYVHISELVAALRDLHVDVRIIAPAATSQASFGDGGGTIDWLKRYLPKWLYELLELGYGLFAVWRLWRAAHRDKPDAIYERYNLHTPAGAIVSAVTGIPLILEVNAPLAEERHKHDGLGLPGLAGWVEQRIWRAADAVIAVTSVLGTHIMEAGVPAGMLHIMPNAIDAEAYASLPNRETAKSRWRMDGRLVLGFVGFVRAWHGLDAIIDWLAKSGRTDLLLVIAGEGPQAATLLAQARRLRIEHQVRHLGLIARSDVPGLLAGFDIALQPAAIDYASPLKLIEYMAAGCAVIAPDQANIREIARQDETAFLFDQGRLTDALDRLVQDTALRARLGEQAKSAIAMQRLTWRSNAERVRRLVLDLKRARYASAVRTRSKAAS